jgi:hypothetical protein
MVEEILKRVLPKRLERKWLEWAYVDRSGNIVFENVDLLSEGCWERCKGKPLFDDDLRKGIMRELFENDSNFDVHVCGSGRICEIDEDGHGVFEFEVWDVKKDRVVFAGVAWGECQIEREREDKNYVECIIHTVTLEPVEEG